MAAEIELARRQRRNGELEAALEAYRRLAERPGVPSEVLLERGQVEAQLGRLAAARETFGRVLTSDAGEPLEGRAAILLAAVEVELDDPQAALSRIAPAAAPDGLADLVALLRAEAAVQAGDLDRARLELGHESVRASTNRLLLERAGQVAEGIGDPALAAELYLRGSRYPGWSAERSRLAKAAADAFAQAGMEERAIEQYRALIEVYGWTSEAVQAVPALEQLGGLTSYHRGLIEVSAWRLDEAQVELEKAAAQGEYRTAARSLLRYVEEGLAWRVALDDGTAESYRTFYRRYPDSSLAAEARFQEGLAFFQNRQIPQALGAWESAAEGATGEDSARLRLWVAKALQRLGREAEARSQLEEAARSQPAGYYTLRARDLLAGEWDWPRAQTSTGGDRGAERAEVERWLANWVKDGVADPPADERLRRGLGLLALGLDAEAAAELNALVEDSRDGRFLFGLAEALAERGVWTSSARAAVRLAALSPAKTVADAPLAVQRLAYPLAYWDLVLTRTETSGLDPLLLLALIRQESIYDPLALSPAGARGLAQVMPATGKGIASSLGRAGFVPDDLLRPSVAVEFGASYLAGQMRSFGGDAFLALAAYNAGGGPIPRWSIGDPDLFVERIDYSETKSYVRQVYVHHSIYRRLGMPPEP